MNLLVTGASGFIGSRFCAAAAAAGHRVTALVRARSAGRALAADRVVHGSLPYDIPARAWEGIEAVVHCAAATTGQDDAESRAINLDGTRFLIEQCRARAGAIRRFVFLSSQSAHEAAISAYGITKREGEKLIRDSGIPYAILRPGLVFGPGRQGLFFRMRATVRKLPVLPLLGGGRAVVQPVEVGDLAEAMLRCLELPESESAELNLGEPEGMALRDFLQAIAVAESGRRKLQLTVPLGPIKAAVAVGEALRLPLPISGDNIRGMEVVRRMETAPSLERLGLRLKPFAEAMREAVQDEVPVPAAARTAPLRVLLIGAGKIGIVHALNLMQREGVELSGLVDPKPRAFGLYRTMGFRTRYFEHLDPALEEARPDGAVIATPAAIHLPLARKCVELGLPVLVEKPLAISRADLEGFLRLRSEFPGAVCHAGYMAAQAPHLDAARDLLVSGGLGAVRRFWGLALQSHIMAAKPVRWEMLRSHSGGGALINFAGHVLSILLRLFGLPAAFEAGAWTVHSTEVEDVVDVRLRYEGFEGRLFGTWSVPGYARPENRIEIEAEHGTVIIENYCVSLKRNGRTERVWTQKDFDVGFNAAPDYTGGGFAAEHRNFAAAIRAGAAPAGRALPGTPDFPPSARLSETPVGIEEAARLEGLMFDIYQEIERSGGLRPVSSASARASSPSSGHSADRRIADVLASLVR